MRALLIAPDSPQLNELSRAFPGAMVLQPSDLITLPIEATEPAGFIFLVAQPEALDVASLPSLARRCEELHAEGVNAAFVAGDADEPVLATAGAAYLLNTHRVHLAGGLDPVLDPTTMGMDILFRLTGRAQQVRKIGHPAVSRVALPSTRAYLTVLSRNLTSAVQLPFLAPLFTGIVDHSLRLTGADTSALDLQRSPGGDDIPTITYPREALAGAQVLREWGDDLPEILTAKHIISESRRIPDSRLPYLHRFVDEVWASTGIPEAQRELLESAFADLRSPKPGVAFVSTSENRDRALTLAERLDEVSLLWEPDTGTVFRYASGDWIPTDVEEPENASIVYSVGIPVRRIPWIGTSSAVLVLDATRADLEASLRTDWVGNVVPAPFVGPEAIDLATSILRADRIIARDAAQRDFFLGALAGMHRIDQYTYDDDHSLESLVSVEDGTEQGLAALSRPVRPGGSVRTTPEYERAPFATLGSAKMSIASALKTAPTRALSKVKGFRK